MRAGAARPAIGTVAELRDTLLAAPTIVYSRAGASGIFFADWLERAGIAAEVNGTVENIGARRLYTVMERVFEDLSFAAPDKGGDEVRVDAAFVERELGELARSADLSRYVL